MNIRIKIRNNQYVITSDQHQYILQKEIIDQKGNKRLVGQEYYTELTNLLSFLYKMEQRLSEVDSFRELIRESEKLNKTIEDISEQLKLKVA